jgi:hypothetical protein
VDAHCCPLFEDFSSIYKTEAKKKPAMGGLHGEKNEIVFLFAA